MTFPVTLGVLKAVSSVSHFLLCAASDVAAGCRGGESPWGLCSHWCFWELRSFHSPGCTVPRAWVCIQGDESHSESKDRRRRRKKFLRTLSRFCSESCGQDPALQCNVCAWLWVFNGLPRSTDKLSSFVCFQIPAFPSHGRTVLPELLAAHQ